MIRLFHWSVLSVLCAPIFGGPPENLPQHSPLDGKESPSGPKDAAPIEIDIDTNSSYRHDFGVMAPDQPRDVVFHLSTNSPVPIPVTSVQAGCSCVVVTSSPRQLSRQNVETLKLSFHARQHGRIEQVVRLLNNDKTIASINLVATRAGFWSQPGTLDFGRTSSQNLTTKTVYLFSSGEEAASIVDVSSTNEYLKIRLRDGVVSEEDKQRGIRLAKVVDLSWDTEKQKLGNHSATVVVRTKESETPEIRIPVSMYLTGDMQFRPGILVFGSVKESQETLIRTSKFVLGDRGSDITSNDLEFKCSHSGVVAKIAENLAGEWELQVSFDPGLVSMNTKESLIRGDVHAFLKGSEVFSVPYVAVIRRSDPKVEPVK